MEPEPGGRAPDRLLAEQSIERLANTLSAETPELARATAGWMRSLLHCRAGRLLTHPEAFPMLLLPWWMEQSINGSADRAFQAEIAYSSVCGYYFVRILDDLMDGDSPPPAPVLPAMIVFHTEFQQAYGHLFPADHPFWDLLRHYSFDAAETASADAALDSVDLDQFARISSRKIAGAKIPLAAVGHPDMDASICSFDGPRWSTCSAAGTRCATTCRDGSWTAARPRDVFPVRSKPTFSG